MALAHLGVSTSIASLEERSAEARACNRFYPQIRDEVLRDFAWPFAGVIATLSLVAVNPTTEWGYSYEAPVDVLAVRRIPNGVSRVDTATTRVRFRMLGALLYTDQPDAEVEYTAQITDSTLFPPDFCQALSLKLAAMIAPTVTSENATAKADRMLALYLRQMALAEMNAANEAGPDDAPESGFIQARA
jgi:hypothetical protein